MSKEDVQMTERSLKRCSASLIVRKVPIKTTARYPSTHPRAAPIKTRTSVGRPCRDWGPHALLVGM